MNKNKEIGILGKHERDLTSLCLSFDGNILYSGGFDNTIRMWDLNTNKENGILGKHDSAVRTLCLSRNGNILFSEGEDSTIKMWDSKNQFFTFLEKMFFFNTYKIKNEEKFKNQI